MAASGWWRAGALVLVTAAYYANALPNDFVWDDRLTATAPVHAGEILTRRTGAYYRPVVMLSFGLDRLLWGGWPAGFHLTNVICHAAAAWLLGALAEALGMRPGVALAAALLFAAHPVQTEAVTYISGRTDVLCALFVLFGLAAWRHARTGVDRLALASGLAFAAALLSKEAAVAVPLALLVRGAHPAARPPRPWLPLAVVAAWTLAWSTGSGPGLRLDGLIDRLPAVGGAALSLLGLLLWPLDLHLERFTPVPGWTGAATLGTWGLLAAIAAGACWMARRVPGGWFLLVLAALAYAPVSGIVPVYPAIADRALFTAEHFLYLPLLGLAPLAAGVAARMWTRRAPAVLAGVLLVWGVIVIDRNRDWRDEETLFRHTIAFEPLAARVWFNLGNLNLAAGRLAEAERLYEAALARDPRDAGAHLNLGITLQRQGRAAAAEAHYRAAIAADPLRRR